MLGHHEEQDSQYELTTVTLSTLLERMLIVHRGTPDKWSMCGWQGQLHSVLDVRPIKKQAAL